MEETQGTKETEGTRWRIGIVAPGCTPSFAVERKPLLDGDVLGVANMLSEEAPEGCFVFAFRSRSESFDRRCAELASLFAVHVGKGEFCAPDAFDFYDGQIAGWKNRLEERARTCIDLRGDVERWRSRARCGWFAAWLFFGLFSAAIVTDCARGMIRGEPALQEQPEQRDEDGHQQAVAARGETGEDPALLPCALLGVEGFEPGVGERSERDDGRVVAEGADDVAANQLRVDERGGDFERGGVGAVGKLSLAGLGSENAEFDVVHAADSTTGEASGQTTEGGTTR